MKVMAFDGSPRKGRNTAILLEKALEGAASRGAETRPVHLHGLNFTGCRSCFACKAKGDRSYARCATRDDLTPLREEAAPAPGSMIRAMKARPLLNRLIRRATGAVRLSPESPRKDAPSSWFGKRPNAP